ncbi:MAG: PAS domain-containing protein [Yonghaparkia sp.]|nr:PAS domain-containing protein [Microcella sp.]
MMPLAYEKWHALTDGGDSHPVFRALHAARLDSFLADSQDDGVMVIDAEGVIVDGNLALSRRTGYSRSELLGRPMVDVVVPAQRRRIRAAIDDMLAGDGVRARADGIKRSGEPCDLAITFVPLFDDDRTVVGALVITQNLSEASEAERDRQRDTALLELASRVAGVVGWTLDLATGALGWSGELPELRGRTPHDLVSLTAMLNRADAARLARSLERCAREQRTLDITVALVLERGRTPAAGPLLPGGASTGTERHLRLVGRVSSSSPDGNRVMSGAAHDVTAVVVEQRQRVAVEELLSSTVNAMTDGFAVIDEQWHVSFVNDRMVEFVGRDRAAIIGESLWTVMPEIVGSEFERPFRDAVEQSSTVQARGWWAERGIWIDVTAYPTGQGLAVHLRDITETELARQAYEKAQEELATLGGLLDISRDAIIVRDLEHRIRYANAGAIALYGWDADTVIGATADQLLNVDRERRAQATEAVLAHGHWSGHIAVRTHDGRDLIIASRWQLMRDESGAPESILSVSVDVTEELAREEALRRAERLESLGTFAGGIAHDLNNVLTPITLAAQLLRQTLAGSPEADTAEMIETAARRGAGMVRQVLTFARGVESGTDRVDVVALLAELERMVGETLADGVALTVTPPPAGTVVIGDATQLLQVLANLISNANDAITAPGTIMVDARLEPREDASGRSLVVDIVDTGHGMSPDVMARLWEPFFTTKPVGKGTGLGLPMVAAIIRAHGGSIDVDSDGRTGSRFTLTLPVDEVAAPSTPIAVDAESARGDGRTVLVVDDEPAIRGLVRQLLVDHGYRVVVASSGDEAQRQLAAAPPVDVVLSDVTMADGDGVDLVRWLMVTGASQPVVLMSGREDAGSIPEEVRARCSGFLVKPLTTSALLTALHTAFDRDPRGVRA